MKRSGDNLRLHHDVLIVGGGPAGLSAALILARARRRVLLCDAGGPRNGRSGRIGGFLTRDGANPAELLRLARDELRAYDTVELREATEITEAKRRGSGFVLGTADNERFRARKLLVATGVSDVLPPIAGIETFYGLSVWHCPYCDGYEHRDRPVAVYGRSRAALDLALELTGWTRHLVLVSDGPCELRPAERRRLVRSGIAVREEAVARLEGRGGQLERIIFASGECLPAEALFFRSDGEVNLALARGLGMAAGSRAVRTRGYGRTSVPGMFIAGDASRHVQFAIVAAGEGAAAAFAINSELLKEDLAGSVAPRPAPARSRNLGTSGDFPGCSSKPVGSQKDVVMPAKSKAQQKAAGAALAAKRGELKTSELKGASKSMAKSMSEKELHDMASTKRKGKADHASKS